MPTDPWSAIERSEHVPVALPPPEPYTPTGEPSDPVIRLRIAYLRDRIKGPKPTIPEVLPAPLAYMRVVGPEAIMHDGNVEESSMALHYSAAEMEGDTEGEMLYRVLARMSVTQRRKMHAMMWKEWSDAD